MPDRPSVISEGGPGKLMGYSVTATEQPVGGLLAPRVLMRAEVEQLDGTLREAAVLLTPIGALNLARSMMDAALRTYGYVPELIPVPGEEEPHNGAAGA